MTRFHRTTICIAAISAAFGFHIHSLAKPPYLDAWEQKYPTSGLPQRMTIAFGAACFVCHHPYSYGDAGTCYRQTIIDLLAQEYTIEQAIDLADAIDSDNDGVSNGVEILTPRADDGSVGYHPGLSGALGVDDCGADPNEPVTGVPETPPSPQVVGDITGDGLVNVNDLLSVINAWGQCALKGPCPADVAPHPDGDNSVNVNDLLLVINHWS